MKPSELNKDGNFSGRINKKIKKALKKEGLSEQSIIDDFIDAKFKAGIIVEPKKKKSK